jgi:hypothetical protein
MKTNPRSHRLNLSLAALVASSFAVTAATFNTDTLIDFANTNYDGQDIVVTNCTVTIDGGHGFSSLHVLNGGTVTHTAAPNGELSNYVAVASEQAFIASTNPVILPLNVLTDTVVVADFTGTHFYTNGTDYTLYVSNSLTQIVRLDGSSIPDGSTIVVSFTFLQLTDTGLNLVVSNDVAIEIGGAVDASGKGYGPGFGAGQGRTALGIAPFYYYAGSGGGYGGSGANSSSQAAGGTSYGSFSAPTDKGSPGAAGLAAGGTGGGAILLTIGGNLRVDGQILANGADALSPASGGGSGGAIWLTSGTLSGAGTIMANGGAGEAYDGGGGGGGRIAIYCTNSQSLNANQFTGALSAHGGAGATVGGAGTLYVSTAGMTNSQLVVDNAGSAGTNTPLSAAGYIDLTVSGGAIVQLASASTFSHLLIRSNSFLGHRPVTVVPITVAQDVTVEAGGGIVADGQGYAPGAGTGLGRSVTFQSLISGSGAGHSGFGGASAGGTAGGSSYDFGPPNLGFLGSGGGSGAGYPSSAAVGGAGGGGIDLTVGGTLLVAGKLTANGTPGFGSGSGGGSGGGILLSVGTVAGAGVISANGGSGELPLGGGGGGGRISVTYGTNLFTGTFSAAGGRGASNGGAGIITLQSTLSLIASLTLDNGGLTSPTNTPLLSNLSLGSGSTLTIAGGATAAFQTATPTSIGTLLVRSNSWLTFALRNPVTLTVSSNATVEAGGAILLDSLGSTAGSGQGAGRSLIVTGYGNVGSGGGHAGYGGAGISNNPGGLTYDSINSPSLVGSGGGTGNSSAYAASGGSGGGALHLIVGKRLQVDGRISAAGGVGIGQNSGGGSGGALSLTAPVLSGAGVISADGGSGDLPYGGGGGGGCVALFLGTNQFTGLLSARGGAGANYGGAGTVFIQTNSLQITPPNLLQITRSLVLVDNGGHSGTNTSWSLFQAVPPLDLALSGGAQLLMQGTASLPTFSSMLIASNSWLIYTNVALQSSRLSVTGNVVVLAGGGILLDGQGRGTGLGSGAGGIYGGGGGYGGYGGLGSNAVSQGIGGGSYGSIMAPIDVGSGGASGLYSGNVGAGAGGGAIQLAVSGSLQVDGRISAEGAPGYGLGSGGGSGGSLWLSASTVTGAGVISANGGAGDYPSGSGGGGGRIAIYYRTNLFAGTLMARGGAGWNYGGAGTVFLQASNSVVPQLTIDNGGSSGARTRLDYPIYSPYKLIVSGGALALSTSSVSFDSVMVGSNSWLAFTNFVYSGYAATASNVTVQAGGGIILDGYGYGGGSGQGYGGISYGPFGYCGTGGGHGGPGGASLFGGVNGQAYDSLSAPVYAGSGGGSGGQPGAGGSGGGALQLRVANSLVVNGRISADGFPASSLGGGAGAGGSLYLTAGTISGSGLVSANGGAGDIPYGGGGGGGRIAIYATNQFTGVISAKGGPGAFFGGAGTIYIKNSADRTQAALVTIDNGGWQGGVTNTAINISENCDLTVSGGASANLTGSSLRNLVIGSNSWLTLATPGPKTLTITSNATIQSGGGITLDGLGNLTGFGPGAGRSGTTPTGVQGGGGGYAGYGGSSAAGVPGGAAYGLPLGPTDLGSGGGSGDTGSPITAGGAGGGALRLTVNGTLTINGKISLEGTRGLGQSSGGGSGGSLWLTAGSLLGTGTISANGGPGDLPNGGGGGGGRVALWLTSNRFTGTVSAWGGAGANYGGAGTVCFGPTNGQYNIGRIIVDNGGTLGTNTSFGQTILPSTYDLTVSGGGNLSLSLFPSGNLHNLLVTPNSWLSQIPRQQSASTFVSFSGDATLQSGGGIRLDGAASASAAPGAGALASTDAYGYTGGGGGNGGCGGSSIAGATGGTAHGSAVQPVDLGGAGGGYVGTSSIGQACGGGALQLNINGTLRLDGRISADGSDAALQGGGGGAGGSLWLSAKTLTGAGSISADGGAGDPGQGGGGGGGRIALTCTSNSFTGAVSAYGGWGVTAGGAGTIYTKLGAAPGQTLVDNGGWQGTNTPVASEVINLTALNGAVLNPLSGPLVLQSLMLDSGASFTHLSTQTNLDITVLGNVVIGTNGAIAVDAKGYNGTTGGPGAGQMANKSSGSGAGYGGQGGASVSGVAGGPAYGSAQQPSDRGSRGGLYPIYPGFCEGGGAIRLRVAGTLSVNGRLSANGDAARVEGAGGGAGGSIWVAARNLDGSGVILANGGPGEPGQGGGGGGGRIALYTLTNQFTGAVAAVGGSGASPGGNGTFYSATIPPPQVIAQSPAGVVSYAVSTVLLTFGSPMDATSLSSDDAVLDTPNGLLSDSNLAVSAQDLSSVLVSFPPQDTLGYYEIDAGPQIRDIYGLAMANTYVGSFVILPPIISGHVTDTNGAPVAYVTIRPDGGLLPALTDSTGAYSLEVPPSWVGTITPSRGTSMFIPASRSYHGVGTDLTNQDFILTPPSALMLTQQPQGTNMNLYWFGINGVTYQMLCSSNLVNWQPYGVALVGTNGPMSCTVPLGPDPAKFFRFGTSY